MLLLVGARGDFDEGVDFLLVVFDVVVVVVGDARVVRWEACRFDVMSVCDVNCFLLQCGVRLQELFYFDKQPVVDRKKY